MKIIIHIEKEIVDEAEEFDTVTEMIEDLNHDFIEMGILSSYIKLKK